MSCMEYSECNGIIYAIFDVSSMPYWFYIHKHIYTCIEIYRMPWISGFVKVWTWALDFMESYCIRNA